MIPGYHRFLHLAGYPFRRRLLDVPDFRLGVGDAEQKAGVPLLVRLQEHKFRTLKTDMPAIRIHEQVIHSEGDFNIDDFPKSGIIGEGMNKNAF